MESVGDQRRAIRRLFLQRHPDKVDDPDANAVFVFLKAEIETGNPAATQGISSRLPYRSFYEASVE